MKGYELIAQALNDLGIGHVFAVPGDGNIFIDYVMRNTHDIPYIKAIREDGAVMMADGFSRTTGEVGVASVTQGPGLTNTATALTTAVRNSTPMLLVVGAPPSAERNHIQGIDQVAVLEPTGAAIQLVSSSESIVNDVTAAYRTARIEQRPTVLIAPLDVQRSSTKDSSAAQSPEIVGHGIPSSDDFDRALGVIASANRPVILAGKGAVKSGARDVLLRLASRLGAPVCTSLMAKGLFDGDDWNLGIVGTLANPVADRVVRDADCIVVFGASLNDYTTASGSLLSDSAVVQCDTNPSAIGRLVPVTVGLVGDVAQVATRMHQWLEALETSPSPGRSDELRSELQTSREDSTALVESSASVGMANVLHHLNKILPPERIIVVDGGRFFPAPVNYLDVLEPSRFVWTLSFGSIGLGLGAAIGAAAGNPNAPSWRCSAMAVS